MLLAGAFFLQSAALQRDMKDLWKAIPMLALAGVLFWVDQGFSDKIAFSLAVFVAAITVGIVEYSRRGRTYPFAAILSTGLIGLGVINILLVGHYANTVLIIWAAILIGSFMAVFYYLRVKMSQAQKFQGESHIK